jgi:hypothetical protein
LRRRRGSKAKPQENELVIKIKGSSGKNLQQIFSLTYGMNKREREQEKERQSLKSK